MELALSSPFFSYAWRLPLSFPFFYVVICNEEFEEFYWLDIFFIGV
jgi:hypothetical protein